MRRVLALLVVVAAVGLVGAPTGEAGLAPHIGFRVLYRDLLDRRDPLVRKLWVPYRAWNGDKREALLVLPAWYRPGHTPSIPLVISPHGRGGSARGNAAYWGSLPALGPFAVVNPQGQGRRLIAYSWGWHGQIQDLARMPRILERALPWLHIDRRRIYAVGSSMGGQETLLLDAFHPRLLAGAVALDSATDMAARYRAFAGLPGGIALRADARDEIGGTPTSAPGAYTARSPISYVRRLATDRVPLFIWWSTRDRVIVDQNRESGRLYRAIKRVNPHAPVYEYVGSWDHSAEMRPMTQLPLALVELGLVTVDGPPVLSQLAVPIAIPEGVAPVQWRHVPAAAALSFPAGFVRTLRGVVGMEASHLPPEGAGRVGRWTLWKA
jgi:pimeloyl-ACP methyl ester carboxylesterase